MTDYDRRIGAAVKEARSHIKDLKRVSPYIFPEWQALQMAKKRAELATIELQQAEAAWKAVGNTRVAALGSGHEGAG